MKPFVMFLALTLAALCRPSDACASCAVPQPDLWFPIDGQAAPLNSRLTVSRGGGRQTNRKLIVRPTGSRRAVAADETTIPGPTGITVVQLTPRQPLAPNTRYEVAIVHAARRPSTYVFGSFVTGDKRDDTAPQLPPPPPARYYRETDRDEHPDDWIDIDVAATDGDRGETRKLFGVWLPDARGKLDTSKQPNLSVPQEGNLVRVSSASVCPGRHMELPTQLGWTQLAIAAFDEASNRSEIRKVTVNFRRPVTRR